MIKLLKFTDGMEEDLELLQSMYIEDKEFYIERFSNVQRLYFVLSELIPHFTDEINLIISIILDNQIINEVKLVTQNNQTILIISKDLLGIELCNILPSKVLEFVIENISSLTPKFKLDLCSNDSYGNDESSRHLELRRVVYSLDHIRNLKKYQKCLIKIAKQSGCSCLLFYGRRIVVIVEGNRAKEFVRLHKSSVVDLDSNGM